MKLRVKISVFSLILIVVVIVALGVSLYFAEKQLIIKEMNDKEKTQSKGLAEVCRQAIITQDDLLIVNYMSKIKEAEGVAYAMYVSSLNNIVTHTDNSFIGQEYKETKDSSVRDVPSPVLQGGNAHLGFSMKYRDEKIGETLNKTRNLILSVAGVSVGIGVIGSFLLALTMTGPIKKLVKGAGLIGEGKLDTVIDVKSKDEIGNLAQEFNRMAQRLKEIEKMKEDFMSSVTHELRSPMTAVKGYVNLILDGKAGPMSEKQREYLTIVRNNTARLGRFINDILDLAKIEAGMMEIKPEPMSVREVANEILTLLKAISDQKNIKLIVDVPESIPQIMADRDRIGQIITNLVGNSLKFTPDGGSVTVKGVEEGEFLKMAIIDTGIGIPKEYIGKIFNKFEQVSEHKQKVKTAKGTGLGLAIARGLIIGHGGKIWIESEVDKGTTFFFTLNKKGGGKDGVRI